MPLKPRAVLVTLVVASVLGVSLTWSGTAAPTVVPVASWVAIVSLGTLLTNGLLWLGYARGTERPSGWLLRRWSRVGYLAGGAAVSGLTVRLVTAADVLTAPPSLAVGGLTGTVALGATAAVGRRPISPVATRALVAVAAVSAGLGLVGIAWADVRVDGGSIGAVLVRAVHLVAVGAWIGGAVWHNAVVVPALGTDRGTEIGPVVRRFRRVVPWLVVAVALTGAHQATTWLGVDLSAYLATTVGRVVALKLLSVVLLTALVVHGRVGSEPTRSSGP